MTGGIVKVRDDLDRAPPRDGELNASVCMAACDGRDFLRPQMDSILQQLGYEDELIIVDDASIDGTSDLLQTFSDPRICLLRNSARLGHVQTLSRAIALARNPLIVLADQDDIWTPGRLDAIRAALAAADTVVVAGNFSRIDSEGRPLPGPPRRLAAGDSRRWCANIVGILLGRRPYYGCAMAFNRRMRRLILPIPAVVESHDLWIAFAGNLMRQMRHVDAELLRKRIHDRNVSTLTRRKLRRLLLSRLAMIYSLVVLAWRLWGRRQYGA